MLRILLASDIHFEFQGSGSLPALPEENSVDLLVLAGDIGDAAHAIDGIDRLLGVFPDTPVVYVAGNHEFYGSSYQYTLARLRATYRQHPQVHFLEMNALQILGYTFLGCTLWTGLNGLGYEVERQLREQGEEMIPDFKQITFRDRDHRGNTRPFRPRDMQFLHWRSVHWLDAQLGATAARKTIVVTHFPPTMACQHPGFPVDAYSAYFQADCEHLIWKYQPALWVYGHNHFSRSERYGKTRLVSNQLGYPGEGVVFSSTDIIVLP